MAQLLSSIPPQLKTQIKEIFDQLSEFRRMENKRRSAERKKKRQQKRQKTSRVKPDRLGGLEVKVAVNLLVARQ
jgi:hypothetical protein